MIAAIRRAHRLDPLPPTPAAGLRSSGDADEDRALTGKDGAGALALGVDRAGRALDLLGRCGAAGAEPLHDEPPAGRMGRGDLAAALARIQARLDELGRADAEAATRELGGSPRQLDDRLREAHRLAGRVSRRAEAVAARIERLRVAGESIAEATVVLRDLAAETRRLIPRTEGG